MIYHNKQNLGGKKPNEFYMKFKQGSILKNENKKDSIYQQKSVVALKSGKVLVAGIEPSSSYGANTNAEANIYDPITNTYGNGLTFNDAQSKYISCFELKANNVYCVYVSYEYYPVSKLRIKHIKVNNMTLTSTDNENKKVINIKMSHGGKIEVLSTSAQWNSFLQNNKDKLVVVDFSAKWCGPCRMIAPKFAEMSTNFPSVAFASVDVDEMDQSIIDECNVSSMPTFQFYRNGEIIDEFVGAEQQKLQSYIEKYK